MKTVCLWQVGTLLFLSMCGLAAAQVQPEQIGRGREWLSWTPVQRNAYVYGLIDGYMMGFYRACDLADQLFEKGKPHHLGDGHHPSDLPSSRCLVHRGEFTKKGFDKQGQPDVSAYTDG